MPLGVSLDKKFDEDGTLNKIETDGYLQTTNLIRRGRIDAMIGIWDSYLYNMRRIGMSAEELGQPFILNEVSFWLMCRRDFDNPEIKKRLANVVNRLRDEKVIRNIIVRYLGEE